MIKHFRSYFLALPVFSNGASSYRVIFLLSVFKIHSFIPFLSFCNAHSLFRAVLLINRSHAFTRRHLTTLSHDNIHKTLSNIHYAIARKRKISDDDVDK